ncbi:MAG TPA: response regulator [Burkholderiales bacterium]|nr:response regulator [Burkholderiales bacterium]
MAANEALKDLDFTGLRAAGPAAVPPQPAPADPRTVRPALPGAAIQVLRRRAQGAQVAPHAPVLVVEDDEDMRRLIHRVLDRMGLVVRTAAEGKAFQAALRQPPLPRLILLDVELPGVSGFKLLTALRRHPKTRDIPVLLVTSRAQDRDLLCGLTLGADGYLSKPFALDALRSMVGGLLEAAA